MKTKIRSLIIILFPLLLLFYQCNVGIKSENAQVWCLRKDSTILARIENTSKDSIYIPKDYIIQYTGSTDTAYFEGVDKDKYGNRSYYFYSKFSEPVMTFQKIKGLKYDSVKTVKSSVKYVRFNPPEMVLIAPGRFLLVKSIINLPVNAHYAIFRFYKRKYSFDPNKDYSEYHSHDGFIEYENNNSYLVCGKIYAGQ